MLGKISDASEHSFLSSVEGGAFQGAVRNLGNNHYHNLKLYKSSSEFKYIHETTPAHYEHKYLQPSTGEQKKSEAMALGSLVHSLLLTPSIFNSEYAIMPDLNLRTNDGKFQRDEFVRANAGKTIVTEEQIDIATSMSLAAMRNDDVRRLLEVGEKEMAFFWNCPYSGMSMKAKLDGYAGNYFIELKTAQSASPVGFARQAYNLHYDLSLAHYLEGVKSHSGSDLCDAYFIVVENKAPYVTQVYKASEAFLTTGRDKWTQAVDKMRGSLKGKKWGGYFPEGEIPEIVPPLWAQTKDAGIDGGDEPWGDIV